jgi:hypothetical protein
MHTRALSTQHEPRNKARTPENKGASSDVFAFLFFDMTKVP